MDAQARGEAYFKGRSVMMSRLYTIPIQRTIDRHLAEVPDYMRPHRIPNAAVIVEALSKVECNAITDEMGKLEAYQVQHCNAITREIDRPLPTLLKPMVDVVDSLNAIFWKYDLDDGPGAWMQSYGPEDYYQLHTDSAPAQMRKLSAVLLLSDPSTYDGGNLRLHVTPREFGIDRAQGTIVVFQPWIPHEVTKVTRGVRHTINLGFWGPPFK